MTQNELKEYSSPGKIYLFKVNKTNTREWCEIIKVNDKDNTE